MTNLYTAEYKGETIVAADNPYWEHSLIGFGSNVFYPKSKLTNITPVKVVPADAIVLEGVTKEEVMRVAGVAIDFGKYHSDISLGLKICKQLLTTPMAEPKEIGERVKINGSEWTKFSNVVKKCWINAYGTQLSWETLSSASYNPTLISKGVVGE